MKPFAFIFAAAIALFSLVSCEKWHLPGECGTITISFTKDQYLVSKSSAEIPDTNNFILEVAGAKGDILFRGPYHEAPSVITATPGIYTITARSCEFDTPQFGCPQWGDICVAAVSSGQHTSVHLNCRQLNAGVVLCFEDSFISAFPEGKVLLGSEQGELEYPYSEERAAYFLPGEITLDLSLPGERRNMMTRSLEGRQMLRISLSASAESSGDSGNGIYLNVDTTRTWLSEEYSEGGNNGLGTDISTALSVGEAKSMAGASGIWVYGFVVAGDLTSKSASFDGPFKSVTNLAIAEKSTAGDKAECLSVQLPKGKVRDALNLVDNGYILRKQIWLKGDIVSSYYGIPGIQGVSDFRIGEP